MGFQFGSMDFDKPDSVDLINARIDANAEAGSSIMRDAERKARIAKIDAAEAMNDSMPMDPAEAEFIRILKAQQELEARKALRKQRDSQEQAIGGNMDIFEDLATSTMKALVKSYTS